MTNHKRNLERILSKIDSLKVEITEGNTRHEVYVKLHHYKAQYHNLMQTYHRRKYFEKLQKRGDCDDKD